jgi:hypothetical protein
MPFLPVTDLNRSPGWHHALIQHSGLERSVDIHRQTPFCTGDGSSAYAYSAALYTALQRQSSHQAIQLPRPIPQHGIRTTHLPRKLARYRNLPQCSEQQALSYGYTHQRFSQYLGRRQRKARLAHLRRFCPVTDPHRSSSLCRRGSWPRTRRYGLRARFNNNRSLSIGLSMGAIPKNQGRSQIAYAARSAGQYPIVYPYFRWQASRCQRTRSTSARVRRILCHGSRLYGLRTSVSAATGVGFLCHSSQVQFAVSKALLSPSEQGHRITLRSNHSAHWVLYRSTLSRQASSDQIPRRRDRQAVCFSDQQLQSSSTDDCLALSVSLADRTVLQVDQTAPANQVIFRYIGECSQDSGLDCSLCVCVGRHHQEATQYQDKSLFNSTDFESNRFRNNTYRSNAYRMR